MSTPTCREEGTLTILELLCWEKYLPGNVYMWVDLLLASKISFALCVFPLGLVLTQTKNIWVFLKMKGELPKQRVPGSFGCGTTSIITTWSLCWPTVGLLSQPHSQPAVGPSPGASPAPKRMKTKSNWKMMTPILFSMMVISVWHMGILLWTLTPQQLLPQGDLWATIPKMPWIGSLHLGTMN